MEKSVFDHKNSTINLKQKNEPPQKKSGTAHFFVAPFFPGIIQNKKASKNIDPEDPTELAKNNYFSLFMKGFFLNFINIGVLGFWLAVLITVGPQLELKASRMITFFTTLILSYLVTDVFKILLAKQLRNQLNPKNIILIKKIISIVLIISGLVLLTQGWFPKEKQIVNSAFEKLEKRK